MKPSKENRVTVTKTATGEGKWKRDSGGIAHYGHVILRVEPNGKGLGVAITKEPSCDSIPESFLAPIAEGIREALNDGAVPGRLVDDIIARVIGGSYHEKDSSEIDFKIAAIFATKEAVKSSEPIDIK